MTGANATPTEKPSPKFLAQDTVSFSGKQESFERLALVWKKAKNFFLSYK